MKKRILLTGITGLIGSNVANHMMNTNHELYAIIRPGTVSSRLERFKDKINFLTVDLANIAALKKVLADNSFDSILHIGALRGGRKFQKEDYFNANVNATEQLIINAIENNSEFIYFSSVGVFGTSPKILPAHNSSPQKAENYYYFTKKQSETLIQKYILQDLKACIIRPSITYGIEDKGFPFKLISMIDKKLLYFPKENVQIHLTDVELLVQAVAKLIEKGFDSGSAYIIADPEPVELKRLADFISQELSQKDYGYSHQLNSAVFEFLIKVLKIIKKFDLISSVEFVSKSWYYDVAGSYEDLGLKSVPTIPGFKKVIDWYKTLK